MKAYVIDPINRQVYEVDYSGDYRQIYQHIDADTFDVVTINKHGDALFVDDEGLFKENQHFFFIQGYPQPLAGKALVLGTTREGESVSPKVSIETIKDDVRFQGDGWRLERAVI